MLCILCLTSLGQLPLLEVSLSANLQAHETCQRADKAASEGANNISEGACAAAEGADDDSSWNEDVCPKQKVDTWKDGPALERRTLFVL